MEYCNCYDDGNQPALMTDWRRTHICQSCLKLKIFDDDQPPSRQVETQVRSDAPLMIAWENYKKTFEYKNTRSWAKTEHVDGSLWAAFAEGWKAAEKQKST